MLDWLAIFGGLTLTWGINIAAGIIIGIAAGMDMSHANPDLRDAEDSGMPGRALKNDANEAHRRFAEALRGDRFFHAASLLISLLAQAIAGYYTAAWADNSSFLHAAIMGALSVAVTFLFDWRDYAPAWLMWAWVALAVPASLAGAWLATG